MDLLDNIDEWMKIFNQNETSMQYTRFFYFFLFQEEWRYKKFANVKYSFKVPRIKI